MTGNDYQFSNHPLLLTPKSLIFMTTLILAFTITTLIRAHAPSLADVGPPAPPLLLSSNLQEQTSPHNQVQVLKVGLTFLSAATQAMFLCGGHADFLQATCTISIYTGAGDVINELKLKG